MHSTYVKGQLANLEVQKRALLLGYHCCIPTVEARFDLVLVTNYGKMYRAQVKYVDSDKRGKTKGVVFLDLRKQTRNEGDKKTYTQCEIDVILAFLPKMNEVLWLPPSVFHNSKGVSLRYSPSPYERGGLNAHEFIWKETSLGDDSAVARAS